MLDSTLRKDIKKEARTNVKRHIVLNLIVVFLVSIVINGGYQFATKPSRVLEEAKLRNRIQGGVEKVEEIRNLAESGNLAEITSQKTNAEILGELLQNIFEFQLPADTTDEDIAQAKYTNGVASVFFNEITGSQSFIFGIINGLNVLIFKGRIANSVTIFIFTAFSIFLTLVIQNPIIVGKNRYFLEQRRYAGTRAKEIFFSFKNDRHGNIIKIMALSYLYRFLWFFTIVGGVIKIYEYKFIPYLIAENPNMTWKEAHELSKKLMMGEKWRYFMLDVSLVPWYLLSFITFNASGLLYSDAYIECIYAETYMRIRSAKKDSLSVKERELLSDELLAIDHIEESEHPSGVEVFDFKIPSLHNLHRDYRRDYSFASIVQLFFAYSFVGWAWEFVFYLANTGSFVNRGTMHGPWLPIYGVGGLLIMLLLKPLREKPVWLFLGTVTVCGSVEYFASWILEVLFDKRWWDYEGYFLTINGRVCFEGLLVFGIAGVAFTYVISPWLDDFFCRMDMKKRKVLCTVLLIFFAADLIWSVLSPNVGDGVTDGLVKNVVSYFLV